MILTKVTDFVDSQALSNLVKVDTSRPASQKFGSAILNIFRHFILLLRMKIKSYSVKYQDKVPFQRFPKTFTDYQDFTDCYFHTPHIALYLINTSLLITAFTIKDLRVTNLKFQNIALNENY